MAKKALGSYGKMAPEQLGEIKPSELKLTYDRKQIPKEGRDQWGNKIAAPNKWMPGDWSCPLCKNHNAQAKTHCSRCNQPNLAMLKSGYDRDKVGSEKDAQRSKMAGLLSAEEGKRMLEEVQKEQADAKDRLQAVSKQQQDWQDAALLRAAVELPPQEKLESADPAVAAALAQKDSDMIEGYSKAQWQTAQILKQTGRLPGQPPPKPAEKRKAKWELEYEEAQKGWQRVNGCKTVYKILRKGNPMGSTVVRESQVVFHAKGRVEGCETAFWDTTKLGMSGQFTYYAGDGTALYGWDRASMGMAVGEIRRLLIPPNEALGGPAKQWGVPENATLDFEIELTRIVAGSREGPPHEVIERRKRARYEQAARMRPGAKKEDFIVPTAEPIGYLGPEVRIDMDGEAMTLEQFKTAYGDEGAKDAWDKAMKVELPGFATEEEAPAVEAAPTATAAGGKLSKGLAFLMGGGAGGGEGGGGAKRADSSESCGSFATEDG